MRSFGQEPPALQAESVRSRNSALTAGATLDKNDAHLDVALKVMRLCNRDSIRNESALPYGSSSDDQYDRFGYCSSIAGAYAIWEFTMGHGRMLRLKSMGAGVLSQTSGTPSGVVHCRPNTLP